MEPDAPQPAATAADPTAPGASARPAPVALTKRQGRSPRDMAMSLLVLLVPIALLLAFYRLVLGGDSPIAVDPQPALQQARAAAVFPVLAPTGLGDDWHVTSASWRSEPEGGTLRLGYVAPDDDSALLVQSSVAPEQLLPEQLGEQAEPRGTFRDGERAWRAYDARPGEIGLVLTEQGRTVILLGTTDEENLEELAASLK